MHGSLWQKLEGVILSRFAVRRASFPVDRLIRTQTNHYGQVTGGRCWPLVVLDNRNIILQLNWLLEWPVRQWLRGIMAMRLTTTRGIRRLQVRSLPWSLLLPVARLLPQSPAVSRSVRSVLWSSFAPIAKLF